MPSQEIQEIRDGTPLEAEGNLTYRNKPPKLLVARILVFKIRPSQEILKIRDGTPPFRGGRNFDIPKKAFETARVARILVFKIRPSQEILKIRDGTPFEAEGILTYRKGPRNCSVWHFSSNLDVPSNVVQEKRVARILVFKVRSSQEILKIRDGTPFEAEGILTYRKRLSKRLVARILVFKVRSSQEILKIRDGTPFEAEGILTYRKRPSKRPSQEILKIRDGTPFEAEGILTYRKGPRNCSVWHFSSNLDVPSNVVQEKRVARILVFKVRSSQEILKIRDGTPFEAEGILTYRKRLSKRSSQEILKIRDEILKIRDGTPLEWPSQEILKIRDGTPFEAEGILTYRKGPRNCSVWHFSSNLDVPSNVVQEKRVARILVFKVRSSQEILKIRDGTPFEAEGILTYRKRLSKRLVARILVFKVRSSQEILKIRDEILKIRDEILKIRDVARILVFKIRPSQEIQEIRDGTPLEAEGNLTYRNKPPKLLGWHFSSKLDVPSNVVQKKRVARILVFKIRPSQEIQKIRDGTPFEMPSQEILKIRDGTPPFRGGRNFDIPKKAFETARSSQEILKIRDEPSQEILKIRDGTPFEAEGILTYRKGPRNCSVWHFSSNLYVPSNVVQEKRVARILVFKVRSSQEILKIRDGTPFEAEGILTYRKRLSKRLVRSSQEILKIRDGTPFEAEGILTYRKRVARILVFKIRPSQEILKIRDVARILVFKIRPSQEIQEIRDGTPLEAEGNLTYRNKPPKLLGWHFSSKLDVPSNVVQKKRVARILVFKIRPSQEIQKIRDGTPFEAEGILTYRKKPPKLLEILKIRDGTPPFRGGRNFDIPKKAFETARSSQEILKIRDGTPFEAEGILTYRKRPSQEILKIRDGTPFEAEGILTYRKGPRNCSVWHFSSNLYVPSNVVQEKRVARILVFKVRSSQEILKIRDGTPFEAEGILTYRKRLSKR
ncbi:hypothetical protein OROMI_030946 [Orobanche minor]